MSMQSHVPQSLTPMQIALARTAALDLTAVAHKLQATDPARWTDERVRDLQLAYRRFLAIHLVHDDSCFVPSAALDEFWHQHILFTEQYERDCRALFGRTLHHDPLFGLRDEAERQENAAGFARLGELWNFYFGEPLVGCANPCGSTDCR